MILLKIVSTTLFEEVRIVLESCLRYTRIPVVVFFFFVQRKRYIHNRSSRSHIRVNVSMQFDGANFPKLLLRNELLHHQGYGSSKIR